MEALAPGEANPSTLFGAWLGLRRRRFHAAAVCATGGVGPALAFFAGIPRRAGIASGVATLMLTDHVDREGTENRAALWLRLGSALGVPPAPPRSPHDPRLAARTPAEQRLPPSGCHDAQLAAASGP